MLSTHRHRHSLVREHLKPQELPILLPLGRVEARGEVFGHVPEGEPQGSVGG